MPKFELPILHNIGPISAANNRLSLLGQCRRLHRSSAGPTTVAFFDFLNCLIFSWILAQYRPYIKPIVTFIIARCKFLSMLGQCQFMHTFYKNKESFYIWHFLLSIIIVQIICEAIKFYYKRISTIIYFSYWNFMYFPSYIGIWVLARKKDWWCYLLLLTIATSCSDFRFNETIVM